MLTLDQIAHGLAVVAREYPIKRAELFGSYADGTSDNESDVDLLMEFSTPRVSLMTLSGIKCRLEELYQKEVDVIHAPLPAGSLLEINRRIPLYGA